MSVLSRVKIDRFRNLDSVDITPSATFNFLFGNNGSGKTSLLEALHCVSVGRSFRTQKIFPLVSSGHSNFTVFLGLDKTPSSGVGLSKSKSGKTELHLLSVAQDNWKDVAERLPVQLINSDSFTILDGSAKPRRRLLDWAMFHVEHSSLDLLRTYNRALKQRNSLIKTLSLSNLSYAETVLRPWNRELADAGDSINLRREEIVVKLSDVLNDFLSRLLPDMPFTLVYKPGWDVNNTSLLTQINNSIERDIKSGTTTVGPHRADIMIYTDNVLAKETLSRGQSKMFVCSLKLALGKLVRDRYNKFGTDYLPIFLLDDLPSELDSKNQSLVLDELADLGVQCFITSVDKPKLAKEKLKQEARMFHVEHGKIAEA
jgi:DNA replication and repair protein RecF